MSKKENSGSVTSSPAVSQDGFNALRPWIIHDNLSGLMGEILTIVDASTEGDKNKAIKDLIKKSFSERQGWISELSWKQTEPDGQGHLPRKDWEDGLIPMISTGGKIYSFIG